MAWNQQAHKTGDKTTDDRQNESGRSTNERQKVAGKCCECGAVYSAWILPDDTVQPIGKKGGCRCGASEFETISK
ncbi:hypothetical protein BBD46_14380 [Natrialba sp. SSL1]|nr:hypothetical protein BBD46_14380 [Natrialba sp. SSL1]